MSFEKKPENFFGYYIFFAKPFSWENTYYSPSYLPAPVSNVKEINCSTNGNSMWVSITTRGQIEHTPSFILLGRHGIE